MADFRFRNNLVGSWQSTTNWEDITTGQYPSPVVPGAGDTVTIDGPVIVTGFGQAATLIGGVLDGTFSLGTWELAIVEGGTVTANTVVGSILGVFEDPFGNSIAGYLNVQTLSMSASLTTKGGTVIGIGIVIGDNSTLDVDSQNVIFPVETDIEDSGDLNFGGTSNQTGYLIVDTGETLEFDQTYQATLHLQDLDAYVLDVLGTIKTSDTEVGLPGTTVGTGTVIGSGTIDVMSGGFLEVLNTIDSSQLNFVESSDATLRMFAIEGQGPSIMMNSNDTLDLEDNFGIISAAKVTLSGGGDQIDFHIDTDIGPGYLTIGGLGASDEVIVSLGSEYSRRPLTSASLVSANENSGTIDLYDGNTFEGAIFLQGNYSDSNFDLIDGMIIREHPIDQTLSSNSIYTILSGTEVGNVTFSSGNAELDLDSGGTIGGSIAFNGAGGTFVIEADTAGVVSVPQSEIVGFTVGDTIELAGVAFTGTGGSYGAAGEDTYTVATAGTLTVNADGTIYNFDIAGVTVGQSDFVLDGDLGITEAECFLAGTRIATPRGDVAVEDLRAGDEVLTDAGVAERILWIGQRSYAARFAARNHFIRPVCLRAGAVAEGVPGRDLFVSPGHGIFVDGVLVPAWRLVNGVSVMQDEAVVADVHYYHVELARHAVIFAEGCAVESYLDIGGRGQFLNAASYDSCAAGTEMDCFASLAMTALPRVEFGAGLEAVRRRVDARAGILARVETAGDRCVGYVDQVGPEVVSGWAVLPDALGTAVTVDVFFWVGGVLGRERVVANLFRVDVRAAGYGTGCCGFECGLPAGAAGVRVVRAVGGEALEMAAGVRVAA